MKTQDSDQHSQTMASRRARLHALLFAGAALGTALLTIGATAVPKLPPFQGE